MGIIIYILKTLKGVTMNKETINTTSPMPKTENNPLGINVLLCPLCMKFSFFAMTRSEAVKHFWVCVDSHKGITVQQEGNDK